jgi:hypothetical protein
MNTGCKHFLRSDGHCAYMECPNYVSCCPLHALVKTGDKCNRTGHEEEKLRDISKIVDRWDYESGLEEEGDKHLRQAEYAMEAIDAVLNDRPNNPILKLFLGGE